MTETATRIAVAVVQQGDELLIGRRPAGVALAGYWEFPGGKVRAGETLHEAAIRECREETAITIVVRGQLASQLHPYDHGLLHLFFFDCRPAADQPPKPPFRWVPRDQLNNYRFPPANQRLLEILTRDLT